MCKASLLFVFALATALCHSHISPLSKISLENIQARLDAQVVLTVGPTIINNGDWVNVTYSGVMQPSNNDWIGVYSPSTADPTTTSPIKFQWANITEGYNVTGSGKLSFRLINMWADYQMRLFQNGTDYPILISSSNIVNFENPNQPLQGHIALTGKPHEMRVSWASPIESGAIVKWGTSPGQLIHSTTAETTTYTAADMCGGDASHFGWRNPGYMHSAVLSRLESSQIYFYRYGSGLAGWSPEFNFTSAPLLGSNVAMFAYGDMGKTELDGSQEHWDFEPMALSSTDNMLKKLRNTNLALHIGDISYAVGYSSQWDEFMNQILPIATNVPYMTCVGNHEMDYPNNTWSLYNSTDSGGECGVAYFSRFIMPSSAKNVPYYSFNYGNVHILLMSTETNFSKGSEQFTFLEQDLASVNRKITPWVIFAGHRPMYIDSNNTQPIVGDQPVAQQLRENLEELLIKYKVNLALWGHHHSYQRTCPLNNYTCGSDREFPVHVVIGMAGFELSLTTWAQNPYWIEKLNVQDWGYTTIETGPSQLKMQYFTNENPSKPWDEFVLKLRE